MKIYLKLSEAADYLDVSVPTIRKYIKSGELKVFKNGRVVRVAMSDLEAFVLKRMV